MFKDVTLISKSWKSDLGLGLVVGVAFIFLNILAPAISIGLPNLGLSVTETGALIVVGILAPIIEEILFRGALLTLILPRLINNTFFNVIIAAAAFAVYHFTAYGASFASASGAFIGAFIFAIIVTLLVLWRKSLLPGIIVHSIFNIYLLSKLTVVFG